MAGQQWGQTGRALGSSIAKFFAGDARQQGELAGLQQLQAEQGLELGGLKIAEARAEAERKRQEEARRSPGALRERAMQVFGAPMEVAPDVEAFQRTGRIDKYDTGGLEGPVMPAPNWAQPDNLQKISQFMAAEQAVQGGGAKSVSDYFKAIADQAEAALTSATAGGQMDPLEASKRFYAMKGNAPFSFNEYGVGNNLEGTVDTSGPSAVRFAQYRDAQTGAQKANAAQSYAAADASRATADLRRTQSQNVGVGGGKAPSGYRWTTNLETGEPMMEPIPGGPADPSRQAPAKPMPATALRMQQEELDAIGLSGGISADLGALIKQIEAGDLKLGPLQNLVSKGRNVAGVSDKNSRNFQSFIATLEKNRNDSLRLNKGVQTEGDAIRAWNEILANVNDEKVVVQRLREVQQLNERAAQLRRMNVDTIRSNFGHPPLDTESRFNVPAAVGGGASGGWGEAKRPRTVARTGVLNGRKVVQYSDGTVEYAD